MPDMINCKVELQVLPTTTYYLLLESIELEGCGDPACVKKGYRIGGLRRPRLCKKKRLLYLTEENISVKDY